MTNSWLPPQHTASHCNTLQHTATHCNALQRTATHCNTLEHRPKFKGLGWWQTHGGHRNIPRNTTNHRNKPQNTATHYNTHTTTHCNNRNTGLTLKAFDDDKMVPAYGFGDTFTSDKPCFLFFPDKRPCFGSSEVHGNILECIHTTLIHRWKLESIHGARKPMHATPEWWEAQSR